MATAASRFLRYIPEDPMRGPDVVAVQRRLKALGIYQGPLDGVYGRGTFDAVVAFQARRNLTPDGTVGPATYEALGQGPVPPSLGDRGPTITIDLEQRRLYLRRRGATLRSFAVAVGSPDSPTPVGRWVVVEKSLNPGGPFGARWMRINIPWGGYAIHSKTGWRTGSATRFPFAHRPMITSTSGPATQSIDSRKEPAAAPGCRFCHDFQPT